jgi:hypothetical protein
MTDRMSSGRSAGSLSRMTKEPRRKAKNQNLRGDDLDGFIVPSKPDFVGVIHPAMDDAPQSTLLLPQPSTNERWPKEYLITSGVA